MATLINLSDVISLLMVKECLKAKPMASYLILRYERLEYDHVNVFRAIAV